MSDFIVGLTGGIGSGKTTVANMFAEHGINIIDADVIARDVVMVGSSALKAISEHFGNHFIQHDGELNRALLRQQIFSHESDKQWLNNLLHPLIHQRTIELIQSATSDYCLLVAPLLIENKLTSFVDRVLVVDVSEAVQITRTTERDNNSKAQVQAIIASQISRAERLSFANDVLENQVNSLENLNQAVLKLHENYLKLSNHTDETVVP